MRNNFELNGKVIVISGVSGQLGYEYAKYLISNHAIVIGLDLRTDDKTEGLIKNNKGLFIYYNVDITNKKLLLEVNKKIIKKFEKIDVLINNAAIDSPPDSTAEENGPFENFSEFTWDKVMKVNLKGTFLCCQVFGNEMSKNKNGSIINISSIYGMLSPDQSLYQYKRDLGEVFYKPVAYSVSKSGIYNLTRYLAVYWAKKNVRVNTMTISGVFNNQDSKFLKLYNQRIPIGRMANPSDFFGCIHYLASDCSKYTTGSNITIDGGWTSI